MNRFKEAEKKISGILMRHERLFEAIFLAAVFCWYFVWVISYGSNNAPDEKMRLRVIKFIVQNNALPIGSEVEVRDPGWGFSYALYPLYFPSLVGALFMKVVSFVRTTDFTLLTAARLASTACGIGTLAVLFAALDKIAEKKYKWLCVFLIAMIPQYAFLSSYINNDIFAVFGSAVILYVWISVAKEGWNLRYALIGAIGIIIIALSYYNAFGWILMSMIFFVFTQDEGWTKKTPEGKAARIKTFKCLGLIVGLVGVCVLPFYIRNYIVNGDMLGFSKVTEYVKLYGRPDTTALYSTPLKNGLSLIEMFRANNGDFLKTVLRSFFGYFGFMTQMMEENLYAAYYLIFGCSLYGAFAAIVIAFFKKKPVLGDAGITGRKGKALFVCAALAVIFAVALAVFYAYAKDYQAQGRYYYPALMGLIFYISFGAKTFVENKYVRRLAYFGLLTIISIRVFINIIPVIPAN